MPKVAVVKLGALTLLENAADASGCGVERGNSPSVPERMEVPVGVVDKAFEVS
jgi:hypothetical protein